MTTRTTDPICRCGAKRSAPCHVDRYVTGLPGHRFVAAETTLEFWAVDEPATASLAACGRCGVVIVDAAGADGEAGRSDHERHHAEIDAISGALADLVDAGRVEHLPAEVADSIDIARGRPAFTIFDLDVDAQGWLRDALVWPDGMHRRVRLAVDEGTLKVKVGEGAWSPPIADAEEAS